jgi:hypothetical protein
MALTEADSIADALCVSVVECLGSTILAGVSLHSAVCNDFTEQNASFMFPPSRNHTDVLPPLHAGFGCRLKAFQCPSGAIRLDVGVLTGSRIHGIVVWEDEHHRTLIAVHGARQLVIATLSSTSSPCTQGTHTPAGSPLKLQVMYHAHSLADWVLDANFASVCWTDAPHSGQGKICCDVAVGMMNNFVELWRVETSCKAPEPASSAASATLLATAASTERLLLYSMRLAIAPQLPCFEDTTACSVIVASGVLPVHTP